MSHGATVDACWESFIIRLDILRKTGLYLLSLLRIFHYSPWYTYGRLPCRRWWAENLSLFALIYLVFQFYHPIARWESFIIRLDILKKTQQAHGQQLRIFHYSPWYTYRYKMSHYLAVENLSLFALIYLPAPRSRAEICWESFIIRLDILKEPEAEPTEALRIFHYSPWYTYFKKGIPRPPVENLSLFALIYLDAHLILPVRGWESFIIRLDILIIAGRLTTEVLRIFHYSPWYTYLRQAVLPQQVENLSLFALIYLVRFVHRWSLCWESFIIRLDILRSAPSGALHSLRIFHYSPWYT